MHNLTFPLRSAFLALPLENEAMWRFQALQETLGEYEKFLIFQNPQSPHLTLRFWPELMQIEYDQIIAQSQKIAERTAPFPIRINGADTFGKPGNEKVLFLTVAFSPELATLKKLCPWPNPPEQKEFHPHITLVRIRHPQRFTVHRKKIFKELGNIDFSATFDRLRFFAEVGGKRQTPLEDFPFSASSIG